MGLGSGWLPSVLAVEWNSDVSEVDGLWLLHTIGAIGPRREIVHFSEAFPVFCDLLRMLLIHLVLLMPF